MPEHQVGWMVVLYIVFFFLKWEQKLCPNLLIKKKIAQLINGKQGKKPLQQTTRKQQHKPATSKPTSTCDQQPRINYT
jgi:hypothetical protein